MDFVLFFILFSFKGSFAFAFSHHRSILPETSAVANEKQAARFTTPVLVPAKDAKGAKGAKGAEVAKGAKAAKGAKGFAWFHNEATVTPTEIAEIRTPYNFRASQSCIS